jgi:dienelactone hydrolase
MKRAADIILIAVVSIFLFSSIAYPANPEEVWIPGPGGKKLHGYLYSPEGGGKKYPLLLISHGTPVSKNNLPSIYYKWETQATYFSRMGFVVVAFARRGYGKSEGWFEEYNEGCSSRNYSHDNLENEGYKDVSAVISWGVNLPNVDASKGVALVGESVGGFTSLNAASKDKRVKAAISFAGGAGGDPKGNICKADMLASYFRKFGSTTPYPTLWFYAEDDAFFQADRAGKAFADEYIKGGGSVIFQKIPAGKGGHGFFSRRSNREIWGPIAKDYLKSRGFNIR